MMPLYLPGVAPLLGVGEKMSNRDNLIAHMDRDIMVLRQSNGRSYLQEPTKE
jgi:hypothetical protein